MSNRLSTVPEDFHTITPHIVVAGVAKAVEFYKRAFGAHELYRNLAPDGTSIIHCELLVGDSRFFVNDEFPEHGVCSPIEFGGTSVTLHLYVDDVDAMWKSVVDAGATVIMPLADQFWGDRYGMIQDPFGHRWSLGSRIEDLSPEQTQERARKHFADVSAESEGDRE